MRQPLVTHTFLALFALYALAVPAAAQEARRTCQQMSDDFGAFVQVRPFAAPSFKGFGLATLETQLAWQAARCTTSPTAGRRPALCQSLSDTFGVVHGKTFARAPHTAQGSWTAMGCNTTPSCQALSDQFGMIGSGLWGNAMPQHVEVWNSRRCNTRPTAARLPILCKELQEAYLQEPDGRPISDLDVTRRTAFDLGCAQVERPVPASTDTGYGFRNGALRRPARLSSTAYGADGSRAVDGNVDGAWAGNSVAHSTEHEDPFLEIDLGAELPVRAVNVWGRTDCCPERSQRLTIEVTPDPCDSPTRRVLERWGLQDGPDARRTLELPHMPAGRFVCVRRGTQLNERAWLNLAEVEVMVPNRATDNLAMHGAAARQSSTAYSGAAQRAIDGNDDTSWASNSITCSGADRFGNPNDTAPWFELDLREPRPIGKVVVFNRTDCCSERLAGARVELSMEPCDDPFRRVAAVEMLPFTNWRFDKNTKTESALVAPRTELQFTDTPHARFVCVRHIGPQFLSLAEVQVFPGLELSNLARSGTARQSTTRFEATADRAIDGNTDGVFEGGSVTFAENDEKTAEGTRLPPTWFELDLGETKPVRQVVVYNRTDDCATKKDGTPSPDKGCNLRLNRTRIELAERPCNDTSATPIATKEIAGYADGYRFGLALPWRNAFDFPDGTNARYVCLRRPDEGDPSRISVAEVQVFGTVAAPPRPLDTRSLIASAASLGPGATVNAPSTSGTAERFSFQVNLAGVKNLACTAERQAEGWSMTCDGLGTLAMTGRFSSPADYALESAETFQFRDLAGRFFPAEFARGLDLVAALAVTEVRLAANSQHGISIVAKLNLEAPGDNALAAALANAQRFLAANVPFYQARPRLEVVAGVAGGAAQLLLRATVIETCAGPTKVDALGAGLKFNKGALVLRVAAGLSSVAIAAGLEGAAFVKPTDRDPWLRYSPGLDLSGSPGSSALTVKGEISGACESECAEACDCTAAQCQGDWNPLGFDKVALRNGYLEIGASTVAAQPVPVITMAFDQARVGNMTGKYSVSLNYPRKQVAFQLSANRLPLIAALGVVGLAGVDLPDALTIRDPIVSFASQRTRVFNTDIPAGLRVDGGLEVPAIGARATMAVNLEARGLVDPQNLGKGLDLRPPNGSVHVGIDIGGLVDRVLRVPVLGGFLQDVLERAFYLTKLEVGGAVGERSSISAAVEYRLLGKQRRLPISSPSVATRPDKLAVELASELKRLLEGEPFKSLYGAVRLAFDAAVTAVRAELARGGKVVINGVLTVSSLTFETAAEAADRMRQAAEAFYNFLRDLCVVC